MPEYLQVTLANVGDSTLDEKFERAMKAVTENIADLNTNARAKREIKISIIFKPCDDDREGVDVLTEVKAVLANQKQKLSKIHIVTDRNTGRSKAVTATFEQRGLFDPAEASRDLTQREAAARATDPTKPAA